MKPNLSAALLLISLLVNRWKCSAEDTIEEEEPDIYRHAKELISNQGYPVEEYQVQTADGYLIEIQRIPHGRSEDEVKDRPVVFLQHGLLGSSVEWVLNYPNQSLAFILADAGYDVWLGNSRGNGYTLEHVTYSNDEQKFWDFSFDEHAMYDLPAMIEFALKKSNRQNLHYIGYSQGTTAGFALLSERPDYDKIKSFTALSPLVLMINTFSPLEDLRPMAIYHQFFYTMFGKYSFPVQGSNSYSHVDSYCESSIPIECQNFYFQISGISDIRFNESRSNVYGAHLPAITSSRNIHHFTQLLNTNTFQKYDFGYVRNFQVYGQHEPPKYELKRIKTPMLLIMGGNDILAEPYNIGILESDLNNPVETYMVKDRLWEGLDFILGTDANKYVYEKVKNYLLNIENMYRS